VTALTRTSLLMLDAHDLHALMERNKRIAERIHEVERSRINRALVTQGETSSARRSTKSNERVMVSATIKARTLPLPAM
jgi:CRP-like cAMP-binding protein